MFCRRFVRRFVRQAADGQAGTRTGMRARGPVKKSARERASAETRGLSRDVPNRLSRGGLGRARADMGAATRCGRRGGRAGADGRGRRAGGAGGWAGPAGRAGVGGRAGLGGSSARPFVCLPVRKKKGCTSFFRGMCFLKRALLYSPPAETRLTVYRRLDIAVEQSFCSLC